MRTIKFRGRDAETGEHIICGVGADLNGKKYIFDAKFGMAYHVAPDSVAQFTEFLDKDGEEVYEGDYLEIDFAGAAKVIGDGSLIRDLETLKPLPEAKLHVEYINARYELVWRTPNGGVDTGVDLYYINAIRKFVKVKEEATTDGRAEQQRLFA